MTIAIITSAGPIASTDAKFNWRMAQMTMAQPARTLPIQVMEKREGRTNDGRSFGLSISPPSQCLEGTRLVPRMPLDGRDESPSVS